MSDEEALLAAIWAEPQEDTPRLAYADWLEETGRQANVARAQFIRLQCETAVLDEDDPEFRSKRAAANKLLARWGSAWRMSVPAVNRLWPWHRGFPQPDDRGIDADDLFALPEAELRRTPCRSFCVMDAAERFDELLAWPHLDRLDTFYLRSGVPTGKWISRQRVCPGFRNVARISLIDCPITVPQLKSLLDSFRDQRIVELRLNGSKIGDDGFRMVLNHPVMAGVRAFGVTAIGLTAAGVRALAESRYHPPVPSLGLAWNPIDDEGIAELVRWPGLSRIRVIDLNNARIGDAGAAALAGCASLRGLRKLWLGDNRIGPEGALAIASSPHLKGLTSLYLHENPLTPAALRHLRNRFAGRLKSAEA